MFCAACAAEYKEFLCLYYSTNAKFAASGLTSLCVLIWIKWFVPIAAAKRNGITQGQCIPRRGSRAKSVRETVKLVAVAIDFYNFFQEKVVRRVELLLFFAFFCVWYRGTPRACATYNIYTRIRVTEFKGFGE